jgi:YbgC/YbaW family acyl-CoA thioester hydrolase
MTSPSDFHFHHKLRVRWSEVDAQQVVFNGHYLNYLDVAISEFWRSVGMPYPDAWHHVNGDIFVRKQQLEYHAPARLDDWLDIGVRCERIGNSSITVTWAAWAQGRLLVTGEAIYVFTHLSQGRPQLVTEDIRRQLQAREQGHAAYQIQLGSWADLAPQARVVRTAVFVQEQGIDESDEWDEDDASAVHAVVANLTGLPVATGRLITAGLPEGQAKIGRMAVIRSARDASLGRLVLQGLLDSARARQLVQVSLNAQVSAQAFYAHQGFVPVGEVFDEVGIPHQCMTLSL